MGTVSRSQPPKRRHTKQKFFFFSFLTQKLVLMKQVYRYFHVPTFHRYPFPKVPKGKRQSFPSPPIERLCIHTYMTWRRRKFTAPKRVQNSKRVVGECLPVTQLSAGKWLWLALHAAQHNIRAPLHWLVSIRKGGHGTFVSNDERRRSNSDNRGKFLTERMCSLGRKRTRRKA